MGTTGPGSNPHDTPTILNATLGTKFKLVPGYEWVPRIRLAVQSKEVDGYCQTFDTMTTVARELVDGEKAVGKIIIAMGDKTPDHVLPKGVPAAETLAKTDEARWLLRAVNTTSQIARPLVMAQEVPRDRVAAVRRAFDQTFRDPEVLDEMKKAGLEGIPSSGKETTRTVQALLGIPPSVLAKLKDILK